MMYRNNFVAVIKCEGKILRERDNGSVYLPFGSEYSILLKNKERRRAIVDVEVDGTNVLNNSRLIFAGNEEQEIVGFMRDLTTTNKFKFIQKTKEIQEYRGDKIDDGLVRISYQFENMFKTPLLVPYYKFVNLDFRPQVIQDSPANYLGSTYTGAIGGSIGSTTNNVTAYNTAPRSDEGITVKGLEVKQNYSYGNVGDLDCNIHTIVLHLKGISDSKKSIVKPFTVKSKIACSTCGRKNRSSNKCCYNCGTFLN